MANEMQKTTPFGMRDKVGYMFGDFANDFTFILSSSFLMKFYTDVMGVSAGVVGMIMMIARFVDAFTDVTMGQIVDRSSPPRTASSAPGSSGCAALWPLHPSSSSSPVWPGCPTASRWYGSL